MSLPKIISEIVGTGQHIWIQHKIINGDRLEITHLLSLIFWLVKKIMLVFYGSASWSW